MTVGVWRLFKGVGWVVAALLRARLVKAMLLIALALGIAAGVLTIGRWTGLWMGDGLLGPESQSNRGRRRPVG